MSSHYEEEIKEHYEKFQLLKINRLSCENELLELIKLSDTYPQLTQLNYQIATHFLDILELDKAHHYYDRCQKNTGYDQILKGRFEIIENGITYVDVIDIMRYNKKLGKLCGLYFANEYKRAGNYKLAEKHYRKALRHCSKNESGKIMHDYGTILYLQNKFEEALSAYNSSIIPSEWLVEINKALCYNELNQVENAFVHFENALTMSQSEECKEYVYANRWNVFESICDIDSAIDELKKCKFLIDGKKSYTGIHPDLYLSKFYAYRNKKGDLKNYLKCANSSIEEGYVNYFVLCFETVSFYEERGNEILDLMHDIWSLFEELVISKNEKLKIYRELEVLNDERNLGCMRANRISKFYDTGAEGKIISKLLGTRPEGEDVPIFIKCASTVGHDEDRMYHDFCIHKKYGTGYRWSLDAWQFRSDSIRVSPSNNSSSILPLNTYYPTKAIYAEETGHYFYYFSDNGLKIDITEKIIKILEKIIKLELVKYEFCRVVYYPLMFNIVPMELDRQRECRLILYSMTNERYLLLRTTSPENLETKTFKDRS